MAIPPAEAPALAITGATGEVGSRVAARLADRGIAQRLVVRDAAKAPVLDGAVPVVASALGDADGMRRALEGVQTLFLVSGRETQDRLQQHLTAVDAAVGAGVRRIVYLSFLAAAPDATFTLARQHDATEAHIRASGVRFTFLRNSLYADFVPFFTSAEGVIQGPAGDGRVAWVTRDDIADVVVAALGWTEEAELITHQRAYDVTGPEAYSMAETAAILARVTGRPITYREETMEEARASRAPSGAPDWEIEGWVTSYAAVATGEMDIVSDAVQRIAGHPPQRLAPFLEANPQLWAHLVS
jgi:NAD(P)H dehydrogenase (quinone)